MFQRGVFPELQDKRLCDLTSEQRDDAHEDWIRNNHAFARDPDHIAFLLRRIDELRTANTSLLRWNEELRAGPPK